jgi:hypothetical protein
MKESVIACNGTQGVLDQLASDWLRDVPKSQTSALLRSKEHTPTEK